MYVTHFEYRPKNVKWKDIGSISISFNGHTFYGRRETSTSFLKIIRWKYNDWVNVCRAQIDIYFCSFFVCPLFSALMLSPAHTLLKRVQQNCFLLCLKHVTLAHNVYYWNLYGFLVFIFQCIENWDTHDLISWGRKFMTVFRLFRLFRLFNSYERFSSDVQVVLAYPFLGQLFWYNDVALLSLFIGKFGHWSSKCSMFTLSSKWTWISNQFTSFPRLWKLI